jgi:FlaA1/EpsC-like NDP-sugar epimerase
MSLKNKLTNLDRKMKKIILILFDSAMLIIVLLFSFSIRLGHVFWPQDEIAIFIFIAPLLAVPIFISFRLYSSIIRYIGSNTLWSIVQAVSLYAAAWGVLIFMANIDDIPKMIGVPRSVILINWFLAISAVIGSRIFIRWLLIDINSKNNVLIYGAGSAGRQLCNTLNQSIEYRPIAYIDDSKEIYGTTINGQKVYSQKDLSYLIRSKNINKVFLAMPSISRNRRNELYKYIESFKVSVSSIPSLSKLAQGKVKVNDLLSIDINDLLGRRQVEPNTRLLKINIYKKIVLVTGAGGSIGSELCRQILFLGPKKLILFDQSEVALYKIEQQLLNINHLNLDIVSIIGTVTEEKRLKQIFDLHRVETIYHSAAYKHVPLVESNQSQGVLNNTFGTLTAAISAIASNVETFVLISTDKAVRPTNVMGASKRVAELVLQALSKVNNNTCFTMVRFGNVLDSSGSVIPLFREQIKKGGPLTVTHKDIVRYFMTIPEAVELVIQAGAMGNGGEVFVLDMGEPIRIYDLAEKMIKLSGLQIRDKSNPSGDIEIQYTGLRPGEKLFEELFLEENFSTTGNKLIFKANEDTISWDKLEPMLIKFKEVAIKSDTKKVYDLLKKIVPEFKPNHYS